MAACAQVLTELPRFGLKHVDGGLGWPPEKFRQVSTTMMAFHDCGKFARAFQGLAPGLKGRLVPPIDRFRYTTEARHDTLGWLLLVSLHAQEDGFVASLLAGWQGFWYGMFRVATGHHGRPPRESTGFSGLRLESFFAEEDVTAAATFIKDVGELLLPAEIPTTGREASKILARVSWPLAGLAVLADWLGSNASYFLPSEEPRSLSEYWNEVALPAARRAVADAGLNDAPVATWQGPSTMFDFAELTPLQRSACEVELAKGSGFYFALPTMATANQLHARIKKVYRSFFAGGRPSLVLSHGARDMVAGFRESILLPMAAMREGDLGSIAGTAESSGTAVHCARPARVRGVSALLAKRS